MKDKPEFDEDSDDDDEAFDLLDKSIESFKLFGIFLVLLSLTFITCFNFTKSELIIDLWADPVALAFRSVAIVLLLLCFTGVAIWRNGVTR